MQPTALVADPTGDTDVQAEIEVSARLVDSRREAMRDAADEARSVLAEDRQEFVVRVALMEKDRLARLSCEIELLPELRSLRCPRGNVAKVVQSAFADRDDLR